MATPQSRVDLGPTGEAVAENVRRLRVALGMSLRDLESKLQENGHHAIAHSGLSKIENKSRRVDVDDLMALALALAVTPVALLLPAARSPRDPVELTGWGSVDASWAWAYVLGTRDLVDVVFTDDDGKPAPPLAARSFPLWAEEEVRRFYGIDQATS
jgi:transcriptional regulator with XRE-family HTH domain